MYIYIYVLYCIYIYMYCIYIYIYLCVCPVSRCVCPVVPILPSVLRQDLDFDTMPLVALSDKPSEASMAGTLRGFNVEKKGEKREEKGI